MNYESENIKLYQLIKREYNNFQKQFRKNQIYYFFQILNVKKNEILNFCKELIYKDYYNIIFAKTYYSYSALSITFLFYFLDLTFLLSDLLIKDNKIISSEKFYVDDMFSFILGNMFILREDPLDDEMKELFEHNICFWLSINILYFIYNNNAFEINSKTSKVKENNSNNNNKKRKRNDGNKDDFLEPIKQSTKSPNKPKTKKETIEKAIFRDFVRFITINENKEEIKQIIAQDKDFWKKLKNKEEYNGYNLGDYSQKLMKFLFEKDVIRELYKIYKKDELLWHWKKVKESKKDPKYNEFYKKYRETFDQKYIIKSELNLEENSENSCANNISIKNNNNLNNLLFEKQSIQEQKIFNNNNIEEKKGGMEMFNDLTEKNFNTVGNNDFGMMSIGEGFFGFTSSINHSFGNDEENESRTNLFNSISSK